MNERILELSYEAQRYALNNTTGPDLAGLNELWQEKFAELIVKECIQAVSDDGIKSDWYQHLIKQHFGVEDIKSSLELQQECDSPELCKIAKVCAGQFGTKRICGSAQPASEASVPSKNKPRR